MIVSDTLETRMRERERERHDTKHNSNGRAAIVTLGKGKRSWPKSKSNLMSQF